MSQLEKQKRDRGSLLSILSGILAISCPTPVSGTMFMILAQITKRSFVCQSDCFFGRGFRQLAK